MNTALMDCEQIFSSLDTEPMRLCDLLEGVSVKEKIVHDKLYRLLGVRLWGKGTFIREEKRGREIKGSALYQIERGWIIYNRLFAYRGSFAIVAEEHDKAYASGEFPTFKLKEGVKGGDALCRYIVHYLNSPNYLRIVEAHSTGSTKTSRYRFGEHLFLELKIRCPRSTEDLNRVVALLDQADELRREQERLASLSKTLREGVLRMLPAPSRGNVQETEK